MKSSTLVLTKQNSKQLPPSWIYPGHLALSAGSTGAGPGNGLTDSTHKTIKSHFNMSFRQAN